MNAAQGKDAVRMLTAMVHLRASLAAAELPFAVPDVAGLRQQRAEVITQLETYVIPRVMSLESPMLAVVGGSTGAGKSTLVNSLVGHRVTTPGVLRPTTRSPVLVHHPDEATWFGQDRLLPDLVRVDHSTDDPGCIQLVATDAVPRGLAILDAPDVDSVEQRNRELAAHLLQAADLWLFVTSAARYADQVPWVYLRQAAERSTAVAVVLDRTPDEAVQTVATHLARMLASRGLKDSPLFTVHESAVDDEGLLPASNVAEIRGWLETLAADVEARELVVRQTLDGAVRAITRHAYPIADAVDQQARAAAALRAEADEQYANARDRLGRGAGDGSVLQGEVLARWQEFAGGGELLRSLDSRVGGLRDRVVNTIRGKAQQAERVTVAVESALEALVLGEAEDAAAAVYRAWNDTDEGRAALSEEPRSLGRASADLRRRAERTVRDWQLDVAESVRGQASDRRTSARFLTIGLNGLAVSLMVAVLGRSTGTSGRGDRDDAATAARRVLSAVFSAEELDDLLTSTAASLEQRLGRLMGEEEGRFIALLGPVADDATDRATVTPGTTDVAERLREAARRVDDLRYKGVST
ncbi:dynamin family protein [Nocardioides sp. R-C-SC26]|uniref:dynamin family protein n=1 Tax=Nocardioides sp. R-C-SC26 TaxID=2870414 RepID=UPI001E5121B2|nr:dynamin family protein [Nocardioides sp. R-C-SC26]